MGSITACRAVLLLLVLSFSIRAQDDISSLLEGMGPSLRNAEIIFSQGPYDDRSDLDRFDFIVVGAGAAGCVIANRLTEVSHWKVLVLEAGGDETFADDIPYFSGAMPDTDWNYTTVPQQYGGCPQGPLGTCSYPRGRVMGGSTTVNLMYFTRGNRMDYDNWAALGNEGWDYESVLPYFKKMENVQIPELRDSVYHGTNGNIMNSHPYHTILTNYSLEAARALGIPEVDYNGANQTGISLVQSSTFEGTRWSANRGYILGLRRKNLFIRKNCFVTKVLIEKGTAIGVEYIRDDRLHRAFATKEVILSAGAINSPKILMLSGIGPRQHLRDLGIRVLKDLPVGQTLYDHAMFLGLVIKLDSRLVPSRRETLANIYNLAEYFVNHEGPLASLRSSEVIWFYEVGEEARNMSWANMECFVFGQAGILSANAGMFGFTDEFYQNFVVPIMNEPVFQPYIMNLRPRSTGNITLQSSDIYSQPLINPNFFSDEEDVILTVEGIKEAIHLFTTGPFANLGATVYDTPVPACSNYSFGTDEYWSCAVRWTTTTVYHPCGSCKMGPSGDRTAVVNPELKVFGIKDLRVVDASIMPMIPAGHIQVPSYMIGEKAADMIKCDHLNKKFCSSRTK